MLKTELLICLIFFNNTTQLTVINFSNKEAKRQLPVCIGGADMEQVMSVFLGNQFHKILVLEAHVHLGK